MKHRTMIFLSSIRKYNKSDYFMINRRVPVHILGFITKGTGTLTINHCVRKVEAMQPVFLMPGSEISFIADCGELEFYLLLLEPVTITKHNRRWELSRLPEIPTSFLTTGLQLRNKHQTLERLKHLYDEAQSRKLEDDFKLQLQFQDLYSTIMQELLEQEKLPNADEGLQQSISYIHKHLHEKLNLDLLSDIAKLTPSSYSRKFKKVVGVSPFEYLTRIRVEEAKAKLSEGSCSVKEVSAVVGFNSEFYFSRVFKQSVGVAPNLYMRRNKLRIAVAACSNYSDILQSLGIIPVASLNCFRYPGTEHTEHSFKVTVNLGTLRQMKPELILIDRYHRDYEEQLKQIAPTVCIDHHNDWRLVLQTIAELVGCEQSAQLLLKQLADTTNEARKRLRSSIGSGSLTMLRVTHHTVRIQGASEHPLNHLVYAELGLTAGSATFVIDHKLEIQPEKLTELSLQSDYLLVQKLRHGASSDEILKRMQSSPFWQQHEAVRNDRVQFIPNWFAMSWTPNGRNEIIDTLIHLNQA